MTINKLIEHDTDLKLYHIVCSECEQPYDFRIYRNGKIVTEQGKKPDVDRLSMVVSHGYCAKCLLEVYRKNGLPYSKEKELAYKIEMGLMEHLGVEYLNRLKGNKQ